MSLNRNLFRVAVACAALAGSTGVIAAASTPDRIENAASATAPAQRTVVATSDVRAATKYPIECGQSESEVASAGGPRLQRNDTTIYIGTSQVTAVNKNPRLIRFDDGVPTWCRTDLETSGDDQQGYGLAWDGGDRLYAVFSATGTQGDPESDFRRVASQGWLSSYSDASTGGGGAKVAVVARIDVATGRPTSATFVTARRADGRVNSLSVTALAIRADGVDVEASSFFSPRGADRRPLTCVGDSPFSVIYRFDAALSSVESVRSDRCG